MKDFGKRIKKGWRIVVTAIFVMLIFTVPASKGIFGKYFGASASNNQPGNDFGDSGSESGSFSSQGSPSLGSTASPIEPGGSSSSGSSDSGDGLNNRNLQGSPNRDRPNPI